MPTFPTLNNDIAMVKDDDVGDDDDDDDDGGNGDG